MLQLRTILYSTDAPAQSRAAFRHAVHLARVHGAGIHLVHVTSGRGRHPGAGQAPRDESTSDEAAVLSEVEAFIRAHDAEDVVVQRVCMCDGDLATRLLAYAAAADADLVVMSGPARHADSLPVPDAARLHVARAGGGGGAHVGRPVTRGHAGLYAAVGAVLVSLVPLSPLWPAVLGGRWAFVLAAWLSLAPVAAAAVVLVRGRRERGRATGSTPGAEVLRPAARATA